MKSRTLFPAALIFGVGVVIAADPIPHYKPGVSEITISRVSQPQPMTEKVCMDTTTEELMLKMSANIRKSMCAKPDIQTNGNQITVNTQCTISNSTMTGHSVTTFTGDTAYHTESSSHFDPPIGNHPDMKTAMDGKWLGACPADMQPGDVILTDSRMAQPMKMNLNDMLK